MPFLLLRDKELLLRFVCIYFPLLMQFLVGFEGFDFGFRLLDTIRRVDGSITMAVCCNAMVWVRIPASDL